MNVFYIWINLNLYSQVCLQILLFCRKSLVSFTVDCNPSPTTIFRLHRTSSYSSAKTTFTNTSPWLVSKSWIFWTSKTWKRHLTIMFHVYWAGTAFLTMFIVGVIIVMLRCGPALCKVRHTTLSDEKDWGRESYDHSISYA